MFPRSEVFVTGTQAGKPVRFSTRVSLNDAEAGNSFIPRLWARMHLDSLLDQGGSSVIKDEIIALSDRLVVMTAGGAHLLREVHGVADEKIEVIPHGIPNVPFAGSKNRLGVEGRPVIFTFGLLSPDKGIELVIDALPEILAHYPDAVYIVLGATHPHIIERHGETYRLMLEDRAKRLGVDSNVIFHNRFVSPSELSEFLAAADIYVTPYLNPEQITSGTLAYALGAGKAVISTPYPYARA